MSLVIGALSKHYTNTDATPKISFYQSSPGPVATQIARSVPWFLRPVAKGILPLMFASPEKASAPAIYLACSPDVEGKTNLYMHLMRFSSLAEAAQNNENKSFVLDFAKAACGP